MHIAALATLEGAPALDEIRARLELRTRTLPALRRVLHRPGPPFGPPVWIDDPAFAIEHQVLEARIAAPGCDHEVLRAAEEFVARPLDRSRPLWEIWFLTGLASGRAAVLLKLHHSVADGLAALEILGGLFDLAPDAPDPVTPSGTPRRGHRRDPPEPRRSASQPGADVPQPAARAGPAPGRRPARAGGGTHVGHAHGATVNDVILTLAAAGLREVLRDRGEPVAGVTLVASVAATVRPASEIGALGNRVGGLMVPLPVGELETADHLEAVAASTRRAKALQLPTSLEGVMVWVTSTWLARAWFRRQRLVNVFETDLPGPPTTIYLLGNRVLDLVPIAAPA